MTYQNTPATTGQAAALPKTYAQHPLSAAFPAMSAEDFQALKDSIENIGPMSPVVIADGQVLDGWDIYRACTELEMDYPVQELAAHVGAQEYLDAQNIGRKASSAEQASSPAAVVLALDAIRIDGNTQSRVELDQAVVAEYAEAMAEGAQFPPLVVFFDGVSHWLADGFHRYFGARKAGLVQLAADVQRGTQQDAQLFSFGVNSAHGLRRSNADKRKAVTGALQHPVSGQWSDRQIAKHCGVSNTFVGSVRASICQRMTDTPTERIVTRNGTTYQQSVANIGKTDKPALAPAPTAAPAAPRPVVVVPPPSTSASASAAAEPLALPDGMNEDDFGPSPEELAASFAAEEDDRKLMHQMLHADDALATLHAEVTRLNAALRITNERFNGLMNEKAEYVRLVKSRDRQIKKLYQEIDELRKQGGAA